MTDQQTCGCILKWHYFKDSGSTQRIEFCPKHSAVDSLLACVKRFRNVMDLYSGLNLEFDGLRRSIDQAIAQAGEKQP